MSTDWKTIDSAPMEGAQYIVWIVGPSGRGHAVRFDPELGSQFLGKIHPGRLGGTHWTIDLGDERVDPPEPPAA